MLVLAIDTALAACSAAVLDTEAATLLASESLVMTRGHAEALLPLVERVMIAAGIGFDALDRIAVTTGPGSFTGLRVGISAARGMALRAPKRAVGLSALAAFAAPHIATDDTVPVVAVIDARHDHVYLQIFGPGGRTLVAPRISSIPDAVPTIDKRAPRIFGSGADLLMAAWPANEAPPLTVDQRTDPDIEWGGGR